MASELEREINFSREWVRSVIDSAHRMRDLGVDDMWVQAMEVPAATLLAHLDSIEHFHLRDAGPP